MHRAAARLGAAFLALALAACAGRSPPPVPDAQATWARHRAAAAAVTHWTAEGRVSVRSAKEGASAALHWQEAPDHATLQASGPLGAGAFTLTRTADGATLRTADGRVRTADDVAALVRTAFGADVPVAALGWWIRGIPAPGDVQTRTLDAYGHLAALEQHGWSLTYQQYSQGLEPPLPTRLRARRGDTEIRLAILRWSTGAEP